VLRRLIVISAFAALAALAAPVAAQSRSQALIATARDHIAAGEYAQADAALSSAFESARYLLDTVDTFIWRGVLVGALFSFMTSLQEASAVLFLSLGGWETITVGIFSFYIAGSANEAAALGVILIVVAAISVAVINRVAGARMGGMFG